MLCVRGFLCYTISVSYTHLDVYKRQEVSPVITKMEMDDKDRSDVIKFLADTDQFFLNIMMATGKAVMDGARQITDGTVVLSLIHM